MSDKLDPFAFAAAKDARPMTFPDSPEGVALALLSLILTRDNNALSEGHSVRDQILDLFRECMKAALGEAAERDGLLH